MNQKVKNGNAKVHVYRNSLDCLLIVSSHTRSLTHASTHARMHAHTHTWQTVKTEGPTALYRGFLPAYLRLGPWNIIVSSHCCCCCCCFVYGMLEIIHTFVFLTITLVLCHLREVKTDILKRKWERDHLGPISLDIPSFIIHQYLFATTLVCLFVCLSTSTYSFLFCVWFILLPGPY